MDDRSLNLIYLSLKCSYCTQHKISKQNNKWSRINHKYLLGIVAFIEIVPGTSLKSAKVNNAIVR